MVTWGFGNCGGIFRDLGIQILSLGSTCVWILTLGLVKICDVVLEGTWRPRDLRTWRIIYDFTLRLWTWRTWNLRSRTLELGSLKNLEPEDMETWRPGNLQSRTCGDLELCIDLQTWRYREIGTWDPENRIQIVNRLENASTMRKCLINQIHSVLPGTYLYKIILIWYYFRLGILSLVLQFS